VVEDQDPALVEAAREGFRSWPAPPLGAAAGVLAIPLDRIGPYPDEYRRA